MRRREMKKTEGRETFSEKKHKHKNPDSSLDYARFNKSIIYMYVTIQKRKAPINKLTCRKVPKTQQVE